MNHFENGVFIEEWSHLFLFVGSSFSYRKVRKAYLGEELEELHQEEGEKKNESLLICTMEERDAIRIKAINSWSEPEFLQAKIRGHYILLESKRPKISPPRVEMFDKGANYNLCLAGIITSEKCDLQYAKHSGVLVCVDEEGNVRRWTPQEFCDTFAKLFNRVAPHITSALLGGEGDHDNAMKLGLEWNVNKYKEGEVGFASRLESYLGEQKAQLTIRYDLEKTTNAYANEVFVWFNHDFELMTLQELNHGRAVKLEALKFPDDKKFTGEAILT